MLHKDIYIQNIEDDSILFHCEVDDFKWLLPEIDENIFINHAWYSVKEFSRYYSQQGLIATIAVTIWVEKKKQE